MKKTILALGFATLATAAIAAGNADFAAVDADANGAVTLEEAAAAGWEWTADDFAAADTDGDGSLNADEFAAAAAM